MNRVKSFSVAAAIAAAFVSLVGRAAAPPACDPDSRMSACEMAAMRMKS